ncbi:MAG: P-II family nitrogen regulator [Dehalococcoidia bacterium]|nr:P-II family nitrogen regulator [Dehalococcoidia bacterium]
MTTAEQLRLLITIVRRGWGDRVIEAARRAGAEGATDVFARGVGVHEHQKLLGIPIEPEKEMILIVIPQARVKFVMEEIIKSVDLDKPGMGMAFTLPVEDVVGIVHFQDHAPVTEHE